MGFFDHEHRKATDSLDRMFDYNRDGYLDCGEEAAEFSYLKSLSESSSSSSYLDEEEAILDEIEGMDADEAREFLELEGFDIDDFDF